MNITKRSVRHVLALDIGGTKTTAGVVAMEGDHPRILTVETIPTPAADGGRAVLAAALEVAHVVVQDAIRQTREGTARIAHSNDGITDAATETVGCEAKHIDAVGIASAGVIDSNGRVSHATDAISGWAGTDIQTPFLNHFNAPTRVLNDVHAHGLGEARFGVGREVDSMLLVAVGTGIGGCHVLKGHSEGEAPAAGTPVIGTRGAAGHVGHIPISEAEGLPCSCGRTGHLEALACGPGIVAHAKSLGLTVENGLTLAAAAHSGDQSAIAAYRTAGFATGRVIGSLLNVLDVDVVALTGGVAQVGSPWRGALEDGIAHEAMDVVANTPVYDAAGGVNAALLGAAVHALAQ